MDGEICAAPAPEIGGARPRLVFFRSYGPTLPRFIREQLDDQARCLGNWFDVTVIHDDCDYDQVCDRIQPDLALFESGVYPSRRRITNTHRHPHVPKLGFANADAYCLSRARFISDMDRWGVETFFTLSVSMAEYTPELAPRLFVWPNSVDPGVYHDYGERKLIPVLMTGSQAPHYPWRNQVALAVSSTYPVMSTPHFGWFDSEGDARTISGERYARLLNASFVVPTCGTIAKDVVRKHLEIPASRACLLAEPTRSLAAAGFADMQNCVLAEGSEVLDKLDFLFRNEDVMQRITDAGYELVHGGHTSASRNQIFQWYELNRVARPDQRIVQSGPFEQLRLVDKHRDPGNTHVYSGALDRELLSEGDVALREGRYAQARRLYLRVHAYHSLPDALLRLTICSLHEGRPADALEWIREPLDRLIRVYDSEPDPVAWGYFIRALLCDGKTEAAAERASQFPHLHHPELDRIRAAVSRIVGAGGPAPLRSGGEDGGSGRETGGRTRPSIHELPDSDLEEWRSTLISMLRACGRPETASRLATWEPAPEPGPNLISAPPQPLPLEGKLQYQLGVVKQRMWRRLPRESSDPALVHIENLVRKLPLRTAVIMGYRSEGWRRRTGFRLYEFLGLRYVYPSTTRCAAVRVGIERNPHRPTVVIVPDSHGRPDREWLRNEVIIARGALPLEQVPGRFAIAPADLVMWMSDRAPTEAELESMLTAEVVILDRVGTIGAHRISSRLVEHGFDTEVVLDGSGAGSAVYRRVRTNAPVAPSACVSGGDPSPSYRRG